MIALLLAVADLRERQLHPEPEPTAKSVRHGSEDGDAAEMVRRG